MSKPTTSSFLQDNTKAMYQPWRHSAFKAEIFVQAMKPIERWMYATLLHEEFDYSTRPYLPDDDAILWMLAGCESRKQWDQHKVAVRAMFTSIEVDGKPMLSHKKVLADWSRMQESLAAKREAGRIAGIASGKARRTKPNDRSTTVQRNRTTVEPNRTKRTNVTERNVTELNLPTNPPAAEGGKAGKVKQPVLTFGDLQSTWTEYRDANQPDISIGLPRSGFSKLEDNLRAFNLLARVEDIKAAFKVWLDDRYAPSISNGNEINSPLSVFAGDAVQYITNTSKVR